MADWLTDVLAQLQGGAVPQAYMSPASPSADSPFPDLPKRLTQEQEAALVNEASEAAARRIRRTGPRGLVPGDMDATVPFGWSPPSINPMGAPNFAMNNLPPGTGIPVPDNSQFVPFSIGGPAPSPSVQQAKAMTAPPAPPLGPAMAPPALGEAAGEGAAPLAAGMSTDMSAARRPALAPPAPTPMSIAPQMAPVAPERPFVDRLADVGAGLVGLGAQLQGDTGPGERLAAARQKKVEETTGQNMTAQWLLARGAPLSEVTAAVKSPEVLKAMITKYGEAKNAQVIGGRLVRERPDGSVEVLADYSKEDEKAPTQREIKLPNGAIQQQEWNKKAQKWVDVGAPAPGERDRRMSVADVTKLSEEGAKMDQVRGFSNTFKPGYGGWAVRSVGEIANTAGRNLPRGIVGENAADSAAWWQDYDRYKNQVRHGLYGASLTKNEQSAFLAADIHPGMDPEQIKRNLATQQRLVENSIRRKGKALIGSTYDKDAIAKAYGVSPDFFDQEDSAVPAKKAAGSVKIGDVTIPWSVQ